MRDIPLFTTEYGVADLALREIPYRKEAYVRIHDTAYPDAFIKECIAFCRMAGAEKIFATGHDYLTRYPMHTSVWRMFRMMDGLPETDAMTIPVTDETLEAWRKLYNDRMADVPNASYMDMAASRDMRKRGDGYFVHRNGELLGIGIAAADTVRAVAAVKHGAGRDVLLALTHALSGEQIYLEVASANQRAVSLYERMGFLKTAELSNWYRIFPHE